MAHSAIAKNQNQMLLTLFRHLNVGRFHALGIGVGFGGLFQYLWWLGWRYRQQAGSHRGRGVVAGIWGWPRGYRGVLLFGVGYGLRCEAHLLRRIDNLSNSYTYDTPIANAS